MIDFTKTAKDIASRYGASAELVNEIEHALTEAYDQGYDQGVEDEAQNHD